VADSAARPGSVPSVGDADPSAIDSLVDELCGNESLLAAIQEVIVRKLRKRPHLDSTSKRKLIDKTVIEIFHKIDIGEMLLNELTNNTANFRVADATIDPLMPRPAYSEEEPRPSEAGAARTRGKRRAANSGAPTPGTVSGGSRSSQQYRAPECLAPSTRRRIEADSQHRDKIPIPAPPYAQQEQQEEDAEDDLGHRRPWDLGATQLVDLRAISESMEEFDNNDEQQGPELVLADSGDSPPSSEAETEPLGTSEERDRQRLRQQHMVDEVDEEGDIEREYERHHLVALGQEYSLRDSLNRAHSNSFVSGADQVQECSDAEELAVIDNNSRIDGRVTHLQRDDISTPGDLVPLGASGVVGAASGIARSVGAYEGDSHADGDGDYDSLYRDETWEEEEEEEKPKSERDDGGRKRRVVFHENVVSDVFLTRYKFDRCEVADLFFTVEEGYQFQVDFDRELDRAKEANKGWLDWIMERTDEEAARHEAEDRWPGGGDEGETVDYEVEAIEEEEFF
jgi:hypothetical protein